VLPSLPNPLLRLSARVFALVLALSLPGTPLSALEVSTARVRRSDDALWVDVRLENLFSERVAESLSRGMPARLQLRAELWRKRTAWFDKFETSTEGQFRVQFEAWERVYRLQGRGVPAMTLASLDSVSSVLSRTIALRLAPIERLQRGGRYYVVVDATLQPLSVEDVEQLEGWLSGEVDTKRSEGFGAITELPRTLFDAVRNFAGFGDQRARALSEEFGAGVQ
jgi:hypothetical protein